MSTSNGLQRRSFLFNSLGLGVGAMMAGGALFNKSAHAHVEGARANAQTLNAGDVAILKFLAAAELVETDLWQQYCELAMGNKGFINVLSKIDPSLPSYVCQNRDNENSHAAWINAYLQSKGEQPVNLDAFRTLPSVTATGAKQTGRLTNLTALTVDTSYYTRYRGAGNPDFGDTFPQIVDIVKKPTLPMSNSVSGKDLQAVGNCAAFHFASIEQGGSSLYNCLSTKVSSLEVLSILASIGPVEVYQFSAFHGALEGISKLKTGDLDFPDLRRDTKTSRAHFPLPCKFIDASLPPNSVIRPRTTANAGAVAAATGLVKSGLFAGQPQAFFDAVVALATAADGAERSIV